MASCPNKSHPDWQALESRVGEYTAMAMYRRNGAEIPNVIKDLKLPPKAQTGAPVQEGISNQQWINALKRLKAYNAKLGTAHILKNSQLGESTMYTYQVTENWNSELHKTDPVANNKTDQLDLFTDMFQLTTDEVVNRDIELAEGRYVNLENSMQSFLQTIGVDVQTVQGITDANGNPISAIAKANMLNRIVEVVEGKAGVNTLPEEASHFFVRLLRVNNHPLYDSLKKEIRDYAVFQEVKEDYDEVYDSNVDALEEEAIGKLISKVIVSNITDAELPKKVSRAKRWFAKVLDYLRKLIGSPSRDPYKAAAMSIMNRNLNNLKLSMSLADSNLGSNNFYELEDENVKLDIDKVADTLNEFENTNERFSEKRAVPLEDLQDSEFSKWMVEDGGLVERYWDNVKKKVVANRATDRPGAVFVKRVGIEKAREINANRNNEIKRTGGTTLHSTMERLMQLFMYQHGDRPSILRDSGLTEAMFKKLENNTKQIIEQSKIQQMKINPAGVFHIRTEQVVHSEEGKKGITSDDVAGSIDLVVLYSDNSADIYDYKFITPSSDYVAGYGKGAKIVANPFGAKMEGYHMQLSTYKDILKRVYGVSKTRKSRVIPLHVEYESKKIDGKFQLTNKIVNIQTAEDNNLLAQIPLAGELYGDAGIDRLIKRFRSRRGKLNEKRKKIKNDPERYDVLTAEIESLDSAVQNLRVGGGIGELFYSAAGKMQILKQKEGVDQEFLDDGSVNPDYMSWEELNEMTEIFKLYSGIIGNITSMLADLKTTDPDAHAKLKALRNKYAGPIAAGAYTLDDMRTQRIAETGLSQGIQDATRKNRDLAFMEGNFTTASEFENPIFRSAWKLIEQAQVNRDQDLNALEKDIEVKIKDLREWASSNGMSLNGAYKELINPDTGNLHPMYSKDFWDTLAEAKSTKNVAWMKQHYKKKEGYQEKFDKWKKRWFAKIDLNTADVYETNADGASILIKDRSKTREAMKQAWLSQHDLTRDSAWLSNKGAFHLELKPEMQEQYHTEKYTYIRSNKALLDFYTMYQEKNSDFSKRTGHSFSGNFVANLRMDSIDAIGQGHTFKSLSAGLEGLKIHSNEADEVYGVRNPVTGELEAKIPLLYQNALQDAEGNIDNSLKSSDLGRSLYLMGKSVYNYEQKNAIEDQILSLQDFLINHESLLTDESGNLTYIEGELATKETDARANEIFKRLYLNQHLYGQNVQGKDMAIGEFSGKKVVLAAKGFFGAKVLGGAVVPAVAAWAAGRAAMYSVSKKGTFFTSAQMKESSKLFMKQDNTYNFLVNHFEAHQDNKSFRVANSLSSSLLAKTVSMDTLFLGFRKADEWNENNILVSMSQNYGVDADGMPKPLNRLPEGSLSIKELGDIAAENVKNGKEFDMKLSEKGFTKFRGIVRAVGGDVKGQTSVEDGNAVNTYLAGSVLMQFKNWMPRIVRERLGRFRYRSATDTYEQGRYKVLADEARVEEGLTNILKNGLKTGLLLAADAVTFGMGYKMSPDVEGTKKLFTQYKQENIDNIEIQQMVLKDFVEMRRGQLRAAAGELRMILMLFASMLLLGMKGDDDEELYKKTWATRQLYNTLRRTSTELGFTSSPSEFINLTRTSIPLSGLLMDASKALSNTIDVAMEDITGVEDKRDKTGRFYYTGPFIPGFKQLRRFFEGTEQDKRAYQQ